MKTAKLVIGILTLVLSLVVLFQSCAASFGEALIQSNTTSGGSGTFVGILFIAAGVVSIAARNSKGGAIASTILYALAGIIALSAVGIYKDLIVWGVLSLIFALIFLVSIFTQFKDSNNANTGRRAG